MLKISRKEKRTNKEVLIRMKTNIIIFINIVIRKLALAGPVMRGSSRKLMLSLLEGKLREKRKRKTKEKVSRRH